MTGRLVAYKSNESTDLFLYPVIWGANTVWHVRFDIYKTIPQPSPFYSDMSAMGHLQQEALPSAQVESLREFGEWLKSAKFESKGGGIELCVDKDLAKKVDPLLLVLGTKALVCIIIL